MRPPIRLLMLTLSLWWLLPGGAARAEAPRVVIVSASRSNPQLAWVQAERRIEAELGLLGITVVRVEGTRGDLEGRLDEMGALAKRHKAIGAISVTRASAGSSKLRIWLEDAVTRKSVRRKLTLPKTADDPAAEVAIQAVELMRASLLEARDVRQKRDQPATPTKKAVARLTEPMIARPPRQPEMLGEALLGLASMGSFGALSPSVAMTLELRVALGAQLALSAQGTTSLSRGSVDLGNDGAVLRAAMGLVHLRWAPWGRESWRPAFALGAGSLLLWSEGARGEVISLSDVANVTVVDARAALAWKASSWLGLELWSALQWSLPSVRLRVEGRDTGELGPLWWSAGLAVRAQWWR